MNEFEALKRDGVSRRAFLTRMSAAGLGVAAASLLAGCGGGSDIGKTNGPILDPTNFPGIPGRSADEVVLNYALTLENLEADLYRQALNLASGRPLTEPLSANPADYTLAVSDGGLGALANPGFAYLQQFAYIETAHRDFLRVAIQSGGGDPVKINPSGYKFASPVNADLRSILTAILPLEETGVRAYLGAAGFMNNFDLLTTAVAIHSTEARHSAAIAYILGLDPGPTFRTADRRVTDGQSAPNPAPYSENTFQYYLPPTVVIESVKAFFV